MYIYTKEDEGVRKSHIVVLEDWVICSWYIRIQPSIQWLTRVWVYDWLYCTFLALWREKKMSDAKKLTYYSFDRPLPIVSDTITKCVRYFNYSCIFTFGKHVLNRLSQPMRSLQNSKMFTWKTFWKLCIERNFFTEQTRFRNQALNFWCQEEEKKALISSYV